MDRFSKQPPGGQDGGDHRYELHRELAGAFSGARRDLDRRDYIEPSASELVEIRDVLLGKELVCPASFSRHALSEFSSEHLLISVLNMPPGISRRSNGGFVTIEVSQLGNPDHVKLALNNFPLALTDSRGSLTMPFREEGHSLYFFNLQVGERYTFVPTSNNP